MARDKNLIAGLLQITINGDTVNAVGSFTLNLGKPKREGMVGPDRVHGYKELPQIPKISGEIRDGSALNVTDEILNMKNATIVAHVANGKKYVFEEAYYCADGDIDTEEGKVQFEAEAKTDDELK